jgi:hypothetical protein
MRRLARWGVVLVVAVAATGGPARGQGGLPPQQLPPLPMHPDWPRIKPAVDKGLAYLRGHSSDLGVGESALAALAMSKAIDDPDKTRADPAVQQCMSKVIARFGPNGYVSEKRGGHDNYEAAVVLMALIDIDAGRWANQIEAIANYLAAKQNANGAWDYDDRPGQGDSSMTQYALLALWEAESVGIDLHPKVFDNAANWFLRHQFSDGGWNYHPDEGAKWIETISMTAAGIGGLKICGQLLDRFRQGPEVKHPLLTPLVVEGAPASVTYKVQTSPNAINSAARRGLEWMMRNYQVGENEKMGLTSFYGLYGMERVAALMGKEMGNFDWYRPGVEFCLKAQGSDGSWNSRQYGPAVNTCWAILFATRSTAKTMRVIDLRRLGAGTLLGGRGLPTDLTDMTIANGRVMVKPMNGAIDQMLAVLEDPNAQNADAAFAGLIERYQKQGPDALKPFKDRFRKLLTDKDSGLRRVAAWAIGRMATLDVVPDLILALLDPDPAVVDEARVSLQVISRKLDTYGPPRGASPEQKLEAARRWRDWYETVRPPELEPLDVATIKPNPRLQVSAPSAEEVVE